MSLLKNSLNLNNLRTNMNPLNLVQQKIGGNQNLAQLFELAKTVRNPKQAVMDMINTNRYSNEQIMQIKQMAKSFGISDSDLSQLDRIIRK